MKRKTMEHLAVLQISLNVGQNLTTDERALAMNLTPVYEKWRKETMEEGLQQGLQLGRQDGERDLVFRLLNRRIGKLTSSVESQIQSLSITQLEALGEALLDFTEMADLDDWLRSQS